MRIINYGPEHLAKLPVFGNSADISRGALLMRGATPATENGALIVASGAGADSLAILREAHDYSEVGDTLVAGTSFVTHPADIIAPGRVVRVEYSMATADLIAATQAVSSATITLTSLENDIDAAFLYVVSGTGAGQTNYLTASASGSATLKAAFGTSLDTTSRLIKILPRFHQLASLTSDGTKLSSQAAAGSWTVIVLDTFITRNGNEEQMSPVDHAALVGLDGYSSLRFEADVLVRNTIPYSID